MTKHKVESFNHNAVVTSAETLEDAIKQTIDFIGNISDRIGSDGIDAVTITATSKSGSTLNIQEISLDPRIHPTKIHVAYLDTVIESGDPILAGKLYGDVSDAISTMIEEGDCEATLDIGSTPIGVFLTEMLEKEESGDSVAD